MTPILYPSRHTGRNQSSDSPASAKTIGVTAGLGSVDFAQSNPRADIRKSEILLHWQWRSLRQQVVCHHRRPSWRERRPACWRRMAAGGPAVCLTEPVASHRHIVLAFVTCASPKSGPRRIVDARVADGHSTAPARRLSHDRGDWDRPVCASWARTPEAGIRSKGGQQSAHFRSVPEALRGLERLELREPDFDAWKNRTAADRELLILRIGWNSQSEYEWSEHVGLVGGARKMGLPIDRIVLGRPGGQLDLDTANRCVVVQDVATGATSGERTDRGATDRRWPAEPAPARRATAATPVARSATTDGQTVESADSNAPGRPIGGAGQASRAGGLDASTTRIGSQRGSERRAASRVARPPTMPTSMVLAGRDIGDGQDLAALPASRSAFARDGNTFGFRQGQRPGCTALASKCDGSCVLPVGRQFLDLPGGDLHDVDRVRDHVGRALLTFRPLGHMLSAKHITLCGMNGRR